MSFWVEHLARSVSLQNPLPLVILSAAKNLVPRLDVWTDTKAILRYRTRFFRFLGCAQFRLRMTRGSGFLIDLARYL